MQSIYLGYKTQGFMFLIGDQGLPMTPPFDCCPYIICCSLMLSLSAELSDWLFVGHSPNIGSLREPYIFSLPLPCYTLYTF